MRIVDRVAYINHDIDDAIRFGILAPTSCRATEIDAARRHRLAADRHARARPRRELRARRRHRPERGDRRRDALPARVHVRARLPRPAHTRGARARAREVVRASSTTSSSAATTPTRSSTIVSGMTDRFALDYAASRSLDGADQGRSRSRRSRPRRTSSTVVSARTQLRKVGGRFTGRCPFHEERTPSFSVNAGPTSSTTASAAAPAAT